MKEIYILTRELIETARHCISSVGVEGCKNCTLKSVKDCQAFMLGEMADRLEIRAREKLISNFTENSIQLPCPMGSDIFIIVSKRSRVNLPYHHWIKKSKFTFNNLERVLNEWGERVFHTEEEAQQALLNIFKVVKDDNR